ncbi:N-acetylmuramoyl-L-alanine amidase [Rubrivirga sp. IMCC43871]|uniref:golvesin C-terminal-like domain-containing protein n=1 Tax=Rubrivirga sp. IMCC43871 TaxID=3391575 RepID=UPI00398FD6E4
MSLRSSTSSIGLAALLLLVAASGCTESPFSPSDTPPLSNAAPLDTLFARAGAEFGVPGALLKAIGYTETRWEMIEGQEEFEGMPPAHGLMALRGDRLTEGARLAGASTEAVRTEPVANIRAAAALLSRWADEEGIDRADLEAWGPLVTRYSGIETPAAQAAYVRSNVYGILRSGTVVQTSEGEVLGRIEATSVGTELRGVPRISEARTMSADYGPAIFRSSPNYNSRPSGYTPGMVIIHSCEGNYAGCWGWLTNSQAGASAHYVVNETGSEISQLVLESKRAWHIGASYNCSLNGNTDCSLNGVSSNHFTIGIEHAGYASQSSWNTGLLQTSAELSCDISDDWSIPRDINHFVGHGQLQPYNRTDPGANWPWTDYLNRISSACGSAPPPSTIIVDSNNSLNDTNVGYVDVSGNWTASSHSSDYETGYWWAQTAAVSDGATFWFYLPTAGTRTIDAWWVSGTNRSSTAPFLMYNAGGSQVGSMSANMQANGGKWNTLGTYAFTAGWNRVVLSRWTTSGSVVIADAVRIQ